MGFVAGKSQRVTFTIDGQGGSRTLKVRSHNLSEEVIRLLTTNSESGGQAASIAGILDVHVNVTAYVDDADLPQAGVNAVTAGAKGTLTGHFGTSSAWSVHVMVQKVNYTSEVEGMVGWNFDANMDSTSGSYTRGS